MLSWELAWYLSWQLWIISYRSSLIGDNCKQGILHFDWVQAASTFLCKCLAPCTDRPPHLAHLAHPIGGDTRRDRANPTLSQSTWTTTKSWELGSQGPCGPLSHFGLENWKCLRNTTAKSKVMHLLELCGFSKLILIFNCLRTHFAPLRGSIWMSLETIITGIFWWSLFLRANGNRNGSPFIVSLSNFFFLATHVKRGASKLWWEKGWVTGKILQV